MNSKPLIFDWMPFAGSVDTAVIPAAGRGTRLRDVLPELPKGFLPLGAETLIQRSLRLLRDHGIRKVLIGTGHLAEQYRALAEREGLVTFHNAEFAETGALYTLLCGKPLLQTGMLLLESDILYEARALDALLRHPAADAVLCSGFTGSGDEVYVAMDANGRLVHVSKKKEELPTVDAEMVGIWKVSAAFLAHVFTWAEAHAVRSRTIDYERAFAEASQTFPVQCVVVPDLVWCEIDDAAHLQRAKTQVLPRITG